MDNFNGRRSIVRPWEDSKRSAYKNFKYAPHHEKQGKTPYYQSDYFRSKKL